MEVVGKLEKKLKPESGVSKAGKPWEKMTFVLKLKSPKFPKILALDTFNANVIQFLYDTNIDTVLRCTVEATSREYNGKYYTSVTAFSVEKTTDDEVEVKIEKAKNQLLAEVLDGADDDLPFAVGESNAPIEQKDILLTPRDMYEVFLENDNVRTLVRNFELELI